MSSFNWFNRRFSDNETPGDSSPESTESTESPQAQPDAETSESDASAESSESSEVSQDYLNWAKVAYDNIRKRQQAEATTATTVAPEPAIESPVAVSEGDQVAEASPEPVEAPPPAAEFSPEPVPAPVSDAEAEAVAEPAGEAAEATPVEPIAAASAAAITPEVEPSPSAEPEAAPAALPFWAQAEAERLQRLERLKAEAEELAELEEASRPAAAASSEGAAPSALPEFILDEGFLWSAEVLASQGRRPEDVSIEEITWLNRLRQGLDKTRRSLVNQLRAIVGQGPLNQDAVMEIESLLLQADVGIAATDYIIESLQNKLRQEALPPSEAIAYLKQLLRDMLDKPLGQSYSLTFAPEKDTLNIWLITGVNGAGKTTTIGKIAHIAKKSGYNCLIAAADTFRAAAVQQVTVWGERSNVEVIANPGKNTDPAAVVFDAIAAAQARHAELLLVDTAGRLQNKKNLMDELSKIRRIIDKKAPNAHVESLLVLDSTLGQNGLRQAEVFSEVAKLSGVVLTKLDGTAKGGIALAVVQQLGLPIRFIGAGEGIEDLRPFSSYEFVEALLSG
jgi:fused signal recognition particle receptor